MMVRLQSGALALTAPLLLAAAGGSAAAPNVDILAYFEKARAGHRTGMARKSKPVDARPATVGEIVVTIIKGEGKETTSKPAEAGDMVVRNRCEETGNEQFLVTAAVFQRRYDGPLGEAGSDGWSAYRPHGVPLRYILVQPQDGEFQFLAPWGEPMIARPGDVIVQDPDKPADTYRVHKAAFVCTYEVIEEPK